MYVKKDASSDNLAQTWLVRPSSQAFLSTLRKKQAESSYPSLNAADFTVPAKDYGGAGDNPIPRSRSSRRSVLDLGRPSSHFIKGKIVNKSSFTKPTFKWMRGELIGKGSYGRVYLALNATTGEVMAVKQVELPRIAKDLRYSEQLDVVRALRSESDTLRDLDHPNIVQYLGYEENADCLSIFLEYVPGGTIASCLRKYGKFDESISKSFTAQILNGLEYLHSKQILHRDLKSDNILVEINGSCKISDFGISKKAEGRAFTGMKGTVYWMAPEVLDSDGKGYDSKVDIWSIGCILQEMWTGKRPWSGEELVAVMMKLVFDRKPPPLPSEMKHSLSANALEFLELCFQPDPTRRPSAALLKRHPYLSLPTNWVFPAFEEVGYSSSLARLNSLRKLGKETGTGGAEIDNDNHEYDLATARPNQRTYLVPPSIQRTLPVQPKVKRGPSPPLVTITPPGSPKKNSASTDWVVGKQSPYTASESSGSRSRTSRSSRSRRKTYRITNPDGDSDNDEANRKKVQRLPFTYNPPPLPELGPPVPYSSALDAPSTFTSSSSQHSLNSYLERIGRRRTSRLSRSTLGTTKSRPAHRAMEYEEIQESIMNSDSDPETTTAGSMWKKPPVDLVPVRYKEPRSPVEDRLSRLTARLSLSDRHGESWAPRPHVEDVVQHLEEFFPDHNLDQEVGEGGSRIPGLSLARAGVARGKSIRKMAEEQVSRQQTDPTVLRRRTQLWDSRLQELK